MVISLRSNFKSDNVMINLKTNNEKLLDELMYDKKRVLHWFSTKHMTSKMMKRKVYELQRRCIDNGLRFCCDEPVEWLSKNGNKWMVYLRVEMVGTVVSPSVQCFCYYETSGSAGAFIPIKDSRCVIFTSHFFLRVKQRLGLSVVDKNVLKRFVEYVNTLYIEMTGKGKHGENEGIVYLNGGIGRGIFRDGDCGNIFEVRSFLKEGEQNLGQMRESMNVKKLSSEYVSMPKGVFSERVECGDEYGACEDMERNMVLMGMNPDRADKECWVVFTMAFVAARYGLQIDLKRSSEWLAEHVCDYPSVKSMFEGDGWDCDDIEFSRLVKEGISCVSDYFAPQINFYTIFLSEKIRCKEEALDRMKERRSHYKDISFLSEC